MRNLFEVTEDKEIRIWNKYMSNTYELLSRKDQTIQDCGLYNGQVGLSDTIELQNYWNANWGD